MPGRGPFQDHFSRVAEGYQRFRPGYPEGLYDHLAELAGPWATVWEVAAGSGQASGGLARRFFRLLVTDGSPAQLAAAPAGLMRAVCLAEAAPLRDHTVDLVAVAQAIHWLDHAAFFREVSRVTRTGGHLAAWTYRFPEIAPELDDLLRVFAMDELAPYWPSERGHVESGSIPFPFPERPAPGFQTVAALDVDAFLGYVDTWSAVGRARGATGRDPLEAFSARWRRAWGDAPEREVRWPVTLRVFEVA